MALSEVDRFLRIRPDVQEHYAEVPHSVLLREAFQALTAELDTHGNTERFQELRQEYGQKLVSYWGERKRAYYQAVQEGKVATKRDGEERIFLSHYGDDDELQIKIQSFAEGEENEIVVTATERGIDDFVRPPTIESRVWTDPEDPSPSISYKVTLHSGKIASFERVRDHTDPLHVSHHIRDKRVINC